MTTHALLVALLAITSTRAADTVVSNLPAGWAATDLGAVRKPGTVSYDAATKAFIVRSIGEVTEQRGTFAYTKVNGDFVATCRVLATSPKAVGAGLMMRTSTNANARFLMNAFNGVRFGNGPAMTARQTDGVAAWQPGDITHVQSLPCWVRIIRYRDSVASYYSGDGQEWNLMHFGGVRFSPGLPEEVLVGVVNAQHDSDELESATLDSFSIEQPVKLPYVTSWLGNSFASQYYQGHVQMQIRAMCIQPGPQPLLRVTGQNEGLDSSVFDLDGNLLHMYQLEHSGGEAIASDGQWMFETTGGGPMKDHRLDRFPAALDRIGNGGPERSQTRSALAGTTLTGVAVRDGKVFVADATKERIVVLDATTLAELSAFPTPRPGALALGKDDSLWVVRRPGVGTNGPLFEVRPTNGPADHTPPAQVLCYGLDGQPRPERTLTFRGVADAVVPDKIAVNPVTGNLFVCDVGRSQCVWIFDAQGKPAGHFGEVGGVYQNEIPGRVDATHLYFPRAITFDDTGCLSYREEHYLGASRAGVSRSGGWRSRHRQRRGVHTDASLHDGLQPGAGAGGDVCRVDLRSVHVSRRQTEYEQRRRRECDGRATHRGSAHPLPARLAPQRLESLSLPGRQRDRHPLRQGDERRLVD
ncbi:MAG: hypothetical protein AB9869_22815 [Verrucomicrobiia bacterium]